MDQHWEDRAFVCHGAVAHQTNRFISSAYVILGFLVLTIMLIHINSHLQAEPNQWSSGYYGYTPGYETYGYAPPPQDPNLYYAGYPGYGNYQPQQQQPMMQQPQVYMLI